MPGKNDVITWEEYNSISEEDRKDQYVAAQRRIDFIENKKADDIYKLKINRPKTLNERLNHLTVTEEELDEAEKLFDSLFVPFEAAIQASNEDFEIFGDFGSFDVSLDNLRKKTGANLSHVSPYLNEITGFVNGSPSDKNLLRHYKAEYLHLLAAGCTAYFLLGKEKKMTLPEVSPEVREELALLEKEEEEKRQKELLENADKTAKAIEDVNNNKNEVLFDLDLPINNEISYKLWDARVNKDAWKLEHSIDKKDQQRIGKAFGEIFKPLMDVETFSLNNFVIDGEKNLYEKVYHDLCRDINLKLETSAYEKAAIENNETLRAMAMDITKAFILDAMKNPKAKLEYDNGKESLTINTPQPTAEYEELHSKIREEKNASIKAEIDKLLNPDTFVIKVKDLLRIKNFFADRWKEFEYLEQGRRDFDKFFYGLNLLLGNIYEDGMKAFVVEYADEEGKIPGKVSMANLAEQKQMSPIQMKAFIIYGLATDKVKVYLRPYRFAGDVSTPPKFHKEDEILLNDYVKVIDLNKVPSKEWDSVKWREDLEPDVRREARKDVVQPKPETTVTEEKQPETSVNEAPKPETTVTEEKQPETSVNDAQNPETNTVTEEQNPETNTVTDEQKSENTATEEQKSENTATEERKPENIATEAPKPENIVTEESKPENIVTEGSKPEDTVTDAQKSEKNVTEEQKPTVEEKNTVEEEKREEHPLEENNGRQASEEIIDSNLLEEISGEQILEEYTGERSFEENENKEDLTSGEKKEEHPLEENKTKENKTKENKTEENKTEKNKTEENIVTEKNKSETNILIEEDPNAPKDKTEEENSGFSETEQKYINSVKYLDYWKQDTMALNYQILQTLVKPFESNKSFLDNAPKDLKYLIMLMAQFDIDLNKDLRLSSYQTKLKQVRDAAQTYVENHTERFLSHRTAVSAERFNQIEYLVALCDYKLNTLSKGFDTFLENYGKLCEEDKLKDEPKYNFNVKMETLRNQAMRLMNLEELGTETSSSSEGDTVQEEGTERYSSAKVEFKNRLSKVSGFSANEIDGIEKNTFVLPENASIKKKAAYYLAKTLLDDVNSKDKDINGTFSDFKNTDKSVFNKRLNLIVKDKTFEALVKVYPDNWVQGWSKVEKLAQEKKDAFLKDIEKADKEPENFAGELSDNIGQFKTFPNDDANRENPVDDASAKFATNLLGRVLTDPKNNSLLSYYVVLEEGKQEKIVRGIAKFVNEAGYLKADGKEEFTEKAARILKNSAVKDATKQYVEQCMKGYQNEIKIPEDVKEVSKPTGNMHM